MADEDDVLRPALELAWVVARAEPDSAPSSLRPVLGFTRLPRSALAQVRRAVEDSPSFRSTVAAAAEAVGQGEGEGGEGEGLTRAAWLWLQRPEGWQDELAGLVAEAEAAGRVAAEEKEERSAARKLAAVAAREAKAREAAARSARDAAEARAQLDTERRARRAAEEEALAVQARLDAAEAERDRAVARGDEADILVGRLRSEIGTLRERVASLEREVAAVVDREGVARAVEAASAALAEAATLLEEAAAAASAASEPASGSAARPARPTRSRPRREPAPLPGGVLDDSPEAADHLVKVPGMTLLVDGYNVSKLRWPDVPLDEQRCRLLDALSELAMRTGVHPHVVFDGAAADDVGGGVGGAGGPAGPALVEVTFSPADVEADDILIGLVDEHPMGQPVTVASSDRRVRDGARLRGANTISSPQLLAAARRYGLDR